ncbi:hypothetical protein CYLTODRAFT_412744 [Cylindrobasidium torrendii FP15055 ss-10]|uniref:Uncharacterized protein n=1 Tax=Cylindrobasidium torrendii FP15055 ss-10 TaxID=1314674 RepID=A0A0D7B4X1_9AGAR|nr:hypothetical protein CYLTODRAFT_412744 [Cylindrobasidium torrendii FP15055 ss-10]
MAHWNLFGAFGMVNPKDFSLFTTLIPSKGNPQNATPAGPAPGAPNNDINDRLRNIEATLEGIAAARQRHNNAREERRPEPRAADDNRWPGHQPRTPVRTREAAIIRAILRQHWLRAPPQCREPSDVELENFDIELQRVRRLYGRKAVPEIRLGLDELAFERDVKSIWNKALVCQLVQRVVFVALEQECPRSQAEGGPRNWGDASYAGQEYRRDVELRVRECIGHMFSEEALHQDEFAHAERNGNNASYQGRNRLLNRRLDTAVSVDWLGAKAVKVLRYLGTEGMSSDDDDPVNTNTKIIHQVLWRHPDVTLFVRLLDNIARMQRLAMSRGPYYHNSDAEDDAPPANVRTGRPRDKRKGRQPFKRVEPDQPVPSRRPMNPRPGMAANLYNRPAMIAAGVDEWLWQSLVRPRAPDDDLLRYNQPEGRRPNI